MNSKRGFTLTEILVSIALISIALIILLGVMIAGLESISKGSSYTEAATIAQSRMEKILYTVDKDYYAMDNAGDPLRQDEQVGNYKVHVTLSENMVYSCKYKKVIVEVENTEANSNKRKSANVRLETIFTNKK